MELLSGGKIMKRIIVFRHRRSPGEHDFLEEEIRVDVEDTQNDIREMFKEWVWENVGENATWYEKTKNDEKKVIVFRFRKGLNEHDIIEDEMEFNQTASVEEINKEYYEWFWNIVGDSVNWFEK